MFNIAIVVAAGSSLRMGFDKLTASLGGKTVLEWSLHAFQGCASIASAVLVCPENRLAEFTELAAAFPKFQKFVPGGAERSASVRQGLKALAGNPPEIVVVHDAARPLVSPALIHEVLATASLHRAAAAAHPMTDSLHRADATGALSETVPRLNLYAMQTPQAASYELMVAALEAHPAGMTDEVSALIAHGIHPVPVVHGRPNIKITIPSDLAMAEFLGNNRGH